MVDQAAGLIPPLVPPRGETPVGSSRVVPLWLAASASNGSRRSPGPGRHPGEFPQARTDPAPITAALHAHRAEQRRYERESQ